MSDDFKKARDEACNQNIDRGLLSEPKHNVFNIGADWAYAWCFGKYDPLEPLDNRTREEWRECAVFHTECEWKAKQENARLRAVLEKIVAFDLRYDGQPLKDIAKQALKEYRGEK